MQTLRNPSRRMFFRAAGAGGVAYGLPIAALAAPEPAATWRFQDTDFRMRTHTVERYDGKFLPGDATVQDWAVTATEMEPWYDRFEYLLGVCGKAGNLKGEKIPGGNVFEDPRSREYPNPPMKTPYGSEIFRKAAAGLGYHPFPQPSSNMSRPYTNNCHGPDGRGQPTSGPWLAGHDAGFLRAELLAWKEGRRRTDPSGAMEVFARFLTPADIDAVAAHYAGK